MSRIGPRIWIATTLASLAVVALARFIWPIEADTVRQARQAVSDGRYDEAVEALKHWPRGISDSSESHFLKGRVAVAMGHLAEAANELKLAQNLGLPGNDLALLRALIASKAGRHADSEPTLRQAFAMNRGPDQQVYEALAKVYLETYNLTRALTVLRRWARDFPEDPKPYLWQAEVHCRTGGDRRAAEVDYREALLRDPLLARARLGLAEELRKAHRAAEAAAEYDAYLAVEPDDAVAHLGAGRNLAELGDEAAATAHLERSIALQGKSAEALKELADLAARRGDWARTLAFLDGAIALDPYDVAMRHSRGHALMRLGRVNEARTEQVVAARLRRELDRLHDARSRLIDSPGDLTAQLEIARWLFDHAHDQEGARWAEKILRDHLDEPEASRLLADFHQRRGETGLANFYRLHASSGPGHGIVGKEAERR